MYTLNQNRRWITLALLAGGATMFGFVNESWSGWTTFSSTMGEGALIQVRYRLESFGGAGKEWEWQFRNASATKAAFQWQVNFSDGTKMHLDATLGPGEIGSGWSCDTERKCSGQPRPVFAGFIGSPNRQDGPNRSRGGLVFATCDDSPDDREHDCNVAKLNCNRNAEEVCRTLYPKTFDKCVADHKAHCETSRIQRIQNIRRCPTGKHCKYGTCEE